jgi:protein TonB
VKLVTETGVVPQSVEVGELNGYAVELIAPIYPEIAKKANIQGQVTVQIMLGREGNVISVKAVSGHMFLRPSCENAAYKSKFKPVYSNNETVRATGFLSYNFVR